MTYTKLEEKLRALPEECLEEVSQYVEFVLFKYEKEKKNENSKNENSKNENSKNTYTFFGSIKSLPDGMDLQRRVRDEWN